MGPEDGFDGVDYIHLSHYAGQDVQTTQQMLAKQVLFGKHYGAGAKKIQEWMGQWVDAVKPQKVGFIFLGGPLHCQRIKTDGSWDYKHIEQAPPTFAHLQSDEPPKIASYKVSHYVLKKIYLPSQDYALAYVYQPDLYMTDKLLGDYLSKFFSDELNDVNAALLPVMPPLPEPPKPVQVPDGLRITIGGKTIEWTPDENQLAGLLSWAAQSLGPGKDAK